MLLNQTEVNLKLQKIQNLTMTLGGKLQSVETMLPEFGAKLQSEVATISQEIVMENFSAEFASIEDLLRIYETLSAKLERVDPERLNAFITNFELFVMEKQGDVLSSELVANITMEAMQFV